MAGLQNQHEVAQQNVVVFSVEESVKWSDAGADDVVSESDEAMSVADPDLAPIE